MKRKESHPEPKQKKNKPDDNTSQDLDDENTPSSSQPLSQTVNTFLEHLKGVTLTTNPITIDNPLELKKHLIKKLPNGTTVASEFCIGFLQFISKKEQLHKSILPCKRYRFATCSFF
jgi:hypothetical protein